MFHGSLNVMACFKFCMDQFCCKSDERKKEIHIKLIKSVGEKLLVKWASDSGQYRAPLSSWTKQYANSEIHGGNMGPTLVLSAPDGPHIGPMNLGIRVGIYKWGNVVTPDVSKSLTTWWFHDMETLSTLQALCEGIPQVTDGFPWQWASNGGF